MAEYLQNMRSALFCTAFTRILKAVVTSQYYYYKRKKGNVLCSFLQVFVKIHLVLGYTVRSIFKKEEKKQKKWVSDANN